MTTTAKGKGRGLASVSPERRSEIGRLGGIEVHRRGTGHRWTSEEAREAGKKGGAISRKKPLQQQEQGA